MRYLLLLGLTFLLSSCETLQNSGSLTEAAIKQIQLNAQRKKEKIAQEKLVEKSPRILKLELLTKQQPDDPEVWYNLGTAYWDDYQLTKREFSHDQALVNYEKCLTLAPGNSTIINALYNIHYRDAAKGRENAYQKAKEYFELFNADDKRQLNPPSLAQYVFLYYQKENDNSARLRSSLLKAIQEQPYSDSAYVQLAKIYLKQELHDLAIATLYFGYTLNPESVDLSKNLGDFYLEKASKKACRYDDKSLLQRAAYYYKKTVPEAENAADVHRRLADLYLDLKQRQLAAHEVNLVIEEKPTAKNFAFAATLSALSGDSIKALSYIQQAKKAGLQASDPSYYETYMMLGDWLSAANYFISYANSVASIDFYEIVQASIIAEESQVDLSWLINKKNSAESEKWKILPEQLYQFLKEDRIDYDNACEASKLYFYAGYAAMKKGDNQVALMAFNRSLEQDAFRFIERPLANKYLNEIKKFKK